MVCKSYSVGISGSTLCIWGALICFQAVCQLSPFQIGFSAAQRINQSTPSSQTRAVAERAGPSFLSRNDGLAAGNGSSSLSAKWLLSLAGVALAGASWCLRSRASKVPVCVSNRRRLRGAYERIYGPFTRGDHSVPAGQPPPWCREEGSEPPKDLEWMTLEKWKKLDKNDQRRSVTYYKRTYTTTGEKKIDPKRQYSVDEACDILFRIIETVPKKSDETFECCMNMNLDSKYPDQQIRTSLRLPHGTGKDIRVAVFSLPDEDEMLKELGCSKYGAELAKEIEDGKCDFDVLIAKPQAMPRLAKLGKILGPKRLMPSPKSGTVVTDYAKAFEDFSSGVIELRNDVNSLVQCGVGKASFGKEKIKENFKAVLQGMADKAPAGASAKFWDKVYMGTTQSPSIPIDPSEFPKLAIADDDDDDEEWD